MEKSACFMENPAINHENWEASDMLLILSGVKSQFINTPQQSPRILSFKNRKKQLQDFVQHCHCVKRAGGI